MTFHGHLPAQVGQRMLTGVARLALETLPKAPPVGLQFRPKILDLFKRDAPTLGIKQIFFSMFIRSVVSQLF